MERLAVDALFISFPHLIMERHDTEVTDEPTGVNSVEARLQLIEATVLEIKELLLEKRPEKDWYSVAEVAKSLGKAEWTVREWCRLGRVYASKRDCGRGNAKEWIIAREELERIDNEGLLPL